jgi:protein subunit release factor A
VEISSNLRAHTAHPQCVHTKNIFSLLDLSQSAESYKRLSKHLDSCNTCALEFEKFKQTTESTKSFIPTIVMDQDLKESFAREIEDVFKIMNLNSTERLKNNVTSKFKAVDQFGLDILGILRSKKMLFVYIAIAMIYFGQKINF